MFLHRVAFFPRCEIARLPIVPIICEAELGADEEYLAVQAEHAAVVTDTEVHHRHAHIAHDAMGKLPPQNAVQALPAMVGRVFF
jgi:hypothetical protein